MGQDETSKTYYDASTIEILEPYEAVRRRPGMYVGATDQRALVALLGYTIDSLFRAYTVLGEPLGKITLRFEQNGSATVICGGPTLSETFLEQCAPFLLREFQQGMIRTFLFPVNALSERLSVTIRAAHGQGRTFLFEQGILRGDESHTVAPDQHCDIWLSFWPDFTILDPASFNVQLTQEMIHTSCCAAVRHQITIIDARS